MARKGPKAANGKPQCGIEACDNTAEIGDLCKRCYNGMFYWKDKTPTRIMARQKQLTRLASRMEMLSPNRSRR